MNKTRNHATPGHQEAMAEVRRVVAEAKELSGAADGALTDQLATWVAGRYAVATRQLAADDGRGAIDWNVLRALCHDLVDLRRGDHSAELLRIERERLAMERAKRKEEMERRFWEWAKENRGKICQGFTTSEEKLQILGQVMFGEDWDSDTPPKPGNGNGGAACPAPNSHPIKVDKGQQR